MSSNEKKAALFSLLLALCKMRKMNEFFHIFPWYFPVNDDDDDDDGGKEWQKHMLNDILKYDDFSSFSSYFSLNSIHHYKCC